jgi:hypothetical protein
MIIKIFDNGWGPEFPAKQFEQEILNKILKSVNHDNSKTVLINSVWYNDQYHSTTLEWLKTHQVDHIILVAMLDPAIPNQTWYSDLNCKVTQIGYYNKGFFVDYWALFMQKYWKPIDQQILLDGSSIDLAFMCLNRKPHWHRKKIYKDLQAHNLLDQGLVSLGHTRNLPMDGTYDNLAPNSGAEEYGIPNDLVTLGATKNWQRCFLNIVTETVFDVDQNYFVSEKIYKPILGCRPFLVYAPNGANKWLQDQKFESYVGDFSDLTDLDLKNPDNIPKFLKVLCNQPKTYWQQKFLDLQEKIMYNKNQLNAHIKHQYKSIEKGITCQI